MAKILMVDDEPILTTTLELWLTSEGHAVEIIQDGEQASEQLKQCEYDLIILDWDLPGMSGINICKTFREQGGDTPVLMLTGRAGIEEKEQGFEVGADDYLTKPFHPKELSSRIKALLKRASRAQPAAKQIPQQKADIKYCQICGGYFDLTADKCLIDGMPLITSQILVDSLVGTEIGGRYQVHALIASGGMSIVYQGWHKFLNRLVAIKLLKLQYLTDPKHLRRFQLEAQALGNLKHPNIIAVSDFGMMETQPYLVMDFVNGLSLAQMVTVQNTISTKRAVSIFIQVCQGAHHAHSQGILHRDLKPSNIMLETNSAGEEIAKIVDFGVAKLLPESGQDVEKLTQTGECFGTAHYMSPEQCMGKELDVRSDVYSMGCVMYEILSGKAPFIGDNALDTFQKQIHEQPGTFSDKNPALDIPDELERIVMKSLSKEPGGRQQSMFELKQELSTVSQAS